MSLDSAFPEAALGLATVGRRLGDWGQWQRGLARAWVLRDQLSEPNRVFREAIAGPRYPRPGPRLEHLAAWERVVEQTPERVEGWYELGDMLFHWGPVIGIPNSHREARRAFVRALALDPRFTEPVQHLLDLAIAARDTQMVQRLRSDFLQKDASGESSNYPRWRVALFLDDRPELERLRARFSTLEFGTLLHILGMGQVEGVGLDDVARAAAVLESRPGRPSERGEAATALAYWALNRGRPREALAARTVPGVASAAHPAMAVWLRPACTNSGATTGGPWWRSVGDPITTGRGRGSWQSF